MIITLCGSARFESWFHVWNKVLTLSGHTVFSLTAFPSIEGERVWYTPEQKAELDKAHFRKIDASDAIVVLNVMAYLGESTLNEIEHARKRRVTTYFLQSWGEGCGITGNHTLEWRRMANRLLGHVGYGSPIDTFPTSSHPARRDIWDLLPPAGPYRSSLVFLARSLDPQADEG